MTQARRPSNQHRPSVSRPGSTGLRFGMFAVCVARDPDPGLNKGKAKPLYDLLVTFADVSSRDTGQGYPYRDALAACLDCSKQTVDRAADYLENEIGLVKIHRRKVEGKPDENDANLYEIFDAWLIHGMTPPKGTPPQLVARYGHVVPGLDIDAWVNEHAPDFNLTAWQATYDAKLRAQETKREEQRRKERDRRRKSKKGGDVTHDVTPEEEANGGGGVTHDASSDVTGDASGAVMGDALSTSVVPEPSSTDDEALSGRSPGDGRRPSVGSSRELEAEGDFVASSKDSSPDNETAERGTTGAARGQGTTAAAGKAKHTRQQLDVVRSVRAYFPADVLNGWEDTKTGVKVEPLPEFRSLSDAILSALEGDAPGADRTAVQLGARIEQRWNQHGYARDYYAGKIRNLRAAAVAMVQPLKKGDKYHCYNPRCDNGVDVDTYEDCGTCETRIAYEQGVKRHERAQAATGQPTTSTPDDPPVPVQRTAPRFCEKCTRRFGPKADPSVSVCRECQAEAAAEVLNSNPAATDMWTPADAAAYEEFAAELETGEPADDELAATEEAAQFARLCAEQAAQFGTAEQKAAYGNAGPPPF